MLGAATEQIEMMIGIRIPNVPHAVPVAKESKAAMIKMIGARMITGIPEVATTCATNSPVPKFSYKTPIIQKLHQ